MTAFGDTGEEGNEHDSSLQRAFKSCGYACQHTAALSPPLLVIRREAIAITAVEPR